MQFRRGSHVCHRPIFEDWKLSFTVDLDTTKCPEEIAQELINKAGRVIGLGIMRPSRKGRYGQYQVVGWEPKLENNK